MADRFHRRAAIGLLFFACILACTALSGCELVSLFAGHGSNKALYNIDKNAQVLVLVDARSPVEAPPSWANTLGDRISIDLFRNHAIDHPIPQDRLIELQRDPHFDHAGDADIAVAAGADIVMDIQVVKLSVETTVDGLVTSGHCTVKVRLIDKTGTNLWPGSGEGGHEVSADAQFSLATDRDKVQVYQELTDLLTIRVSRMFHVWNPEDKAMSR